MDKQSGSNLLEHFLAECFKKHLLTLICWMDDCEQHKNKLKVLRVWTRSSASKKRERSIKFSMALLVCVWRSSSLLSDYPHIWSYSSSLHTTYSGYWAPFSPALPKAVGAFVSSRSYRIRPYVVNYSGKPPDAPSTECTELDVEVHGFYTSYFHL